jgi:hypothetical protein
MCPFVIVHLKKSVLASNDETEVDLYVESATESLTFFKENECCIDSTFLECEIEIIGNKRRIIIDEDSDNEELMPVVAVTQRGRQVRLPSRY